MDNRKIDCQALCAEITESTRQKSIQESNRKYIAIIEIGDEMHQRFWELQSHMHEHNIRYKASCLHPTSGYKDTMELLYRYDSDTSVAAIYILYDPYGKDPENFRPILQRVYDFMSLEKDIGCMNTYNIGRIGQDENEHLPIDIAAITRLLRSVELKSKHVVILDWNGRLNQLLTPVLLKEKATVLCCNAHTPHDAMLHQISYADIVVSCIGDPSVLANSNNTMGMLSAGKFFIDASSLIPESKEDIPQSWYENCSLYVPHTESITALSDAIITDRTVDWITAFYNARTNM